MRKLHFAAAALALAASTGLGAATANAAPAAATASAPTTASISIYPCYPSSIWIGICPPKCPTWPPYPIYMSQQSGIICPLY